jgi:glutamyl-tRNA synthetase
VPKGRGAGEVAKGLTRLLEEQLDKLLEWDAATIEAAVNAGGQELGWADKELYMAVRVAATGRAATPPLFETLAVLGKETVRRRLRRAVAALKQAKA